MPGFKKSEDPFKATNSQQQWQRFAKLYQVATVTGEEQIGSFVIEESWFFSPACDISFPCTLCCENLLPSILTVFKCALEKLAGSVGLSGIQNIQNNPSLLPWFWYFIFSPLKLSFVVLVAKSDKL